MERKDTAGILLVNVGTPDAPEEIEVREFLREFLSDTLVVDYPRWLWMPVLENIILKKRPRRSAELYKKIWQKEGSPLLLFTRSLAFKIGSRMQDWQVEVGMRYGNPSIRDGLMKLAKYQPDRLVILPLFPQYSSTTTLTAIKKVREELTSFPDLPDPVIVDQYFKHPEYISVLADNLIQAQQVLGEPDRLIFSYHGIPKRLVTKKGEQYQEQCLATSQLVAQKSGFPDNKTITTFQSRFGPDAWLSPDTEDVLGELGKEGIQHLQIICPGFAVDCLETLEEIAIQGQEVFHQAGGGRYLYLPALNDGEDHVNALIGIIQDAIT